MFIKLKMMFVKLKKSMQLIGVVIVGILMVATVIGFARNSSEKVLAAGPISPPEGYPKLSLSTKVVTPTLANTGGAELNYAIEIVNTGAYTAENVTLTDALPPNTTLQGEVLSTKPPAPEVNNGVITWGGGTPKAVVGFDESVKITFRVKVAADYEGVISNTAVISDPMIAEPVSVMAETRVTDHAVFEISKTASPVLPGKNKPLTYELVVTNVGQEAVGVPITATDFLPADTTNCMAGQDGSCSNDAVTWYRTVDLDFGETSTFTFSVIVGDVISGTPIVNEDYLVNYPVDGDVEFGIGEPYTTTVVDPKLYISKSIFPDPPGANNVLTYTLTVLNLGSMATNLTITDTLPDGLEYVPGGGGDYTDGVVSWTLPRLDTRESAQVTFTASIGDVADVIVLNDKYRVCSAEGVCADGVPVPSLVVGPTFEATADVYPIAHKPGGGSDPEQKILPTLTIHNLGPGNAIDANALLTFGNISVSQDAVFTVEPPGNGEVIKGPDCTMWTKCLHYLWNGNMDVGDVITITTTEPQSTIGGDEWTPYTATVVVTDVLGTFVTEPISATAIGHVTHMSNLIPIKSAPPEIGPNETLSYTIKVVNSGLSTEATPVLTETIPTSTTLIADSVSDGGTYKTLDGRTVISWTLPEMKTGEYLFRSFAVTTDPGLVSGTLIVNDDYQTSVYESWIKDIKTVVGEPVTTTVREVGLIDSYKGVTPTWAMPGEDTVLTYVVHVVNSGPNLLEDVEVTDIYPWEHTTYQRDAVVSPGVSGVLDDDIVSFVWTGDLQPYSEALITSTVVVDDFFEGVVTNTATIKHASLKEDKVITAVTYITDDPVLSISKTATPDPVEVGGTLLYQMELTNLGELATLLMVTDTLPANTEYITGSASSGGKLVDGVVTWVNTPTVLNHGETVKLTYQVKVLGGSEIVNEKYGVCSAEGVCAYGEPIHTKVLLKQVLLPLAFKR